MKIGPYDIVDDLFEAPKNPPEFALWLAVIDRAMIDYVSPPMDVNKAFTKNLSAFFFDTKSPCNLAWICDAIFESDSMLKQIRRRVRKLKISGTHKKAQYSRYRRGVRLS